VQVCHLPGPCSRGGSSSGCMVWGVQELARAWNRRGLAEAFCDKLCMILDTHVAQLSGMQVCRKCAHILLTWQACRARLGQLNCLQRVGQNRAVLRMEWVLQGVKAWDNLPYCGPGLPEQQWKFLQSLPAGEAKSSTAPAAATAARPPAAAVTERASWKQQRGQSQQ